MAGRGRRGVKTQRKTMSGNRHNCTFLGCTVNHYYNNLRTFRFQPMSEAFTELGVEP